MATFLNLPPPPETSEPDSGPSTPMSGISTVAIKDGHEGHHSHFDGTFERMSRLGNSTTPTSYFEINRRPETPTSNIGSVTGSESELDGGARGGSGSGDRETASAVRKRLQQGNGVLPGTGTSTAGTESPASSVTTASAADQREKARLIDGMTYDEGVIDTTDRPGVPVVLNNEHHAKTNNP